MAENSEDAPEALKSVERLMGEFFSPGTENQKKREIESMLAHFEKQPNAWRYCIYFIKNSTSDYVNMFGLTTLENIINKRWETTGFAEKNLIRSALWENFLWSPPKKPSFVRNKMAKLIIDTAKFDWPSSYPTFFDEIIELVEKGGERLILGLILLQAFIEGLAGPYGTESRLSFLSQDRRKELQQLLFHCIPQLLTILASVLDKFSLEQSLESNPSNPPPSPERDGDGSASSIPIPNMLMSQNNSDRLRAANNREECIKISLLTLQHLFAYLPQASHIPPAILQSIFYWANAGSQSELNEEICVIAMSVINEVLYQRHGSTGSTTMACLSNETHKLLTHLNSLGYSSPLAKYSEIYINKISEFLQLFIALYFKKLESESQFDSMGFLLLIFQYTFQVPSCCTFINSLDVWIKFIDCLKPHDSNKYFDALLGLVSGVINKMQFQHNAQLQQLERESTNDDGETEWQIYLRNCIEVIAKIAEFSPLNIFKLIQDLWQDLAQLHDSESASEFQLIDLGSFTQLLGRLAPTLFLDRDETALEHGTMQGVVFLERLMKQLNHANNIHSHMSVSKTISNAYTHVYAEVLACLGSWSYYMVRCSSPACNIPFLLQIGSSLLLNKNGCMQPPVLCHAAAHMILSITVCTKPSNPLYNISDLYLQAQHSLSHLQPKTAGVVRQALCMMILECPMEISESSENIDAKRLQACASLIEAWCSTLLIPMHNSTFARRLSCLPAITQLLNYFSDHPTQTKKILAAAIERPVHAAMEVFQTMNGDTDPNNKDASVAPIILELFLALINSLHQQLGTAFMRNSIHVFLDIAKRKEHGALLQLLRVLQAGVEGGALINTAALEEVLSMCLQHILPLIEEDSESELALFQLFGSILLNRWQHFYASCVRQGWSPAVPDGSSDGAKTDQLSHFRAIMYAIAKTFLADNIDVVRLNLHTLECLNIRYKLYSKIVFRQELLAHNLGILLGILIHRTAVAALLQEEVCTAIYNLAAVDFSTYFDSFLPSFLSTLSKIEQNEMKELLTISKDTDLPTFSQNMLKLAYNIRCYQLMKESR